MSRRNTAADVLARLRVVGECWEWTGARDQKGYGKVGYDCGVHRVHRLIYEWFVGPIPEGHQLDHLCRNRACANPVHLAPVTAAENIHAAGSESPAALNRRKTKCKRGHRLAGTNLIMDSKGHRQCRTCRAEGWHAAYLRRKAA